MTLAIRTTRAVRARLRRRLALGVAALLAASPLVSIATERMASGAPVITDGPTVKVTVVRYEELECVDEAAFICASDGDWFGVVTIGGQALDSRNRTRIRFDDAEATVNWEFEFKLAAPNRTVPISIQLRDLDSDTDPDDYDAGDINPRGGAKTLSFSLDPYACVVTATEAITNAGERSIPCKKTVRVRGAGDSDRAEIDYRVEVSDPDTDLDGITDYVELFGIPLTGGSGFDSFLPVSGANPCRRTIAVEIDWLFDGTISDRPAAAALAESVAMFNAAPVPAMTAPCPHPGFAAAPGIQLLVDQSNAVTVTPAARMVPLNLVPAGATETPFATYRRSNFTTERQGIFHYNLWGFKQDNSSSSGLASPAGFPDDFMVTVGSWGAPTTRQQSGTFVHELGHVLGLGHGGGDVINYKPNYVSVMNYTYQQAGIPDWSNWRAALAVPGAVPNQALLESVSALDFSGQTLAGLVRTSLSEPAGVGAANDSAVFWYDNTLTQQSGNGQTGVAVDWNLNGNNTEAAVAQDIIGLFQECVTGDPSSTETPPTLSTTAAATDVTSGINIYAGLDGICDTTAAAGDGQTQPVGFNYPAAFNYAGPAPGGLPGFNDWQNLKWRMGTGPDKAGTPPAETASEMTEDRARRLIDGMLDAMVRATGADLAVSLNVNPDPVVAGRGLIVTARITNRGPQNATDVIATLPLPAGVTPTTIDGRCGFDSPNSTVRCGIGALALHATTTIELRLGIPPSFAYPSGSVPVPVTVTVGGREFDRAETDNTASVTVTALSAADFMAGINVPERAQIPVGGARPVLLDAAITNLGVSSPVDAAYTVSVVAGPGLVVDTATTGGQVAVETGLPAQVGRTLNVRCVQPGLHRVDVQLSVTTPRSTDPLATNNVATDATIVDCLVGVLALRTGNGQGAETIDVNGTGRWTFSAGGVHSNGGALIQSASTLTLHNGATLTTSTRPVRCTRIEPGCPPPGAETTLRPPVADPLASVPEPAAAGLPLRTFPNCNTGQTCGPILPGRYSGTISLNGGTVLLRPGLYVFENGLVALGGTLAMVPGTTEGATLFFRNGASLDIRNGGGLNLRAPASGPYTGIAVMYARDNTAVLGWRGSRTTITSTGVAPTVYAPNAALLFNTDTPYDTPVRFITGTVSDQQTTIHFRP